MAGAAWRGMAGRGTAWLGAARQAWHGSARRGMAWLGAARRGAAWLGAARRGRHGKARRGGARQGGAGMDIDKLIEEARARIYAYINRVVAQKLRRQMEKKQ